MTKVKLLKIRSRDITTVRYEREPYVVIIKLFTPQIFLILFLIYLYFLSLTVVKFLVFNFLFSFLSIWSVIVPPFLTSFNNLALKT